MTHEPPRSRLLSKSRAHPRASRGGRCHFTEGPLTTASPSVPGAGVCPALVLRPVADRPRDGFPCPSGAEGTRGCCRDATAARGPSLPPSPGLCPGPRPQGWARHADAVRPESSQPRTGTLTGQERRLDAGDTRFPCGSENVSASLLLTASPQNRRAPPPSGAEPCESGTRRHSKSCRKPILAILGLSAVQIQ